MEKTVYLDNSATTQMSEAAKAKMTEAMELFGNPSSLHREGDRASRALKEARKEILATLGVRATSDEHLRQLVFTSCGTEATSTAIFGSAYAKERREATRILTTDSEHPATYRALDRLSKDGFEIVKISTKGGILNADELAAALSKPIFLATFMLVNNETGALYDVKSAFDAIKKKYPSAITHCDAVQGYLKVRFTPMTLGADLISLSAHKIHGPKGIGALYISPRMIKEKRIAPFLFGGGQESGMRSGTENTLGILAFAAAAKEGFASMAKDVPYIASLREYAKERLSALELKINEPAVPAPHVLSVTLPDIKSQTMLSHLSGRGICVSSGSACSSHSLNTSPTLLAFGLSDKEADSTVRISFSKYNTKDDVDALANALADGLRTLVRIKR